VTHRASYWKTTVFSFAAALTCHWRDAREAAGRGPFCPLRDETAGAPSSVKAQLRASAGIAPASRPSRPGARLRRIPDRVRESESLANERTRRPEIGDRIPTSK